MDKKIAKKLFITVFSLVLSAVMVVTISYAWLTLSKSPVAEGISISISGGQSILIAPDTVYRADGETYHYPGKFSDKLDFGRYDAYQYLSELGNLTPVSTADGIHWFIPDYYDYSDSEVINGEALAGQIKSYVHDDRLSYANLAEGAQSGGYVYLDFWMVSPASDYTLRISRGDEHGGSYLMELMEPTLYDRDGDGINEAYTLVPSVSGASASARVGFLVNEDQITDHSMVAYEQSPDYNDTYSKLKGYYTQPDAETWVSAEYRFTIYEPNGNYHPTGENSGYVVTSPLRWNGSEAVSADIRDRLCVQLNSSWKNGSAGIGLEELFQTAVVGKDIASPAAAKKVFYRDYLQCQLVPYVDKGYFIQNTDQLYRSADYFDGVIGDEQLFELSLAGAVDDVCIVTLEKNVPQRIRMFVWLEGQDVDCTNAVSAGDIALSIEFAGSNQK